ncbi:MAG: hypothetical protein KDA05_12595 [Phycisphaerales bacterium]|nr:hypothetical protein [Phycisphaerales bacterium]
MPSTFAALCSDFYVNQKLAVKLDLPRSRETVLDLFERIRREYPSMEAFKRYQDELALESPAADLPHRWLAIRTNSVRTGAVNPGGMDEAYALHRHVLEVAPFFLSISPLDVEHVELLYGFDLECRSSHDEVVHRALLSGTSLGVLGDMDGASPVDCQPVFGVRLANQIEAHLEIKTRGGPGADTRRLTESSGESISVYVILRSMAPIGDVKQLVGVFDRLRDVGEEIVQERVVPEIIMPLRQEIGL